MIKISPLSKMYASISGSLNKHYYEAYTQDKHFDGEFTEKLKQLICKHTQRQYAVITTSGTASLIGMLLCINVKPNDEVICINYSNPASVMPIKLLGAVPVFVDIDQYGSMDLHNLPITQNTKAIIVTGLYGDCPDYDLLEKYNLPVLNDCAQCMFTEYKDITATKLGTMSSLSFSHNKNFPVFGTYGSIVTDDKNLYERLKIITHNGYNNSNKIQISEIGFNGVPSEDKSIQALCSLEKKEEWQNRRSEIHKYFFQQFISKNIMSRPSPSYSKTNFHKFCIFVQNKKQFADDMRELGCEVNLHYTYNFAKTKLLSNTKQSFPYTDFYVQHAVCLPCHPWLSDSEVEKIVAMTLQCRADKPLPKLTSLQNPIH